MDGFFPSYPPSPAMGVVFKSFLRVLSIKYLLFVLNLFRRVLCLH